MGRTRKGAVFNAALFQLSPHIKNKYNLHIIQLLGIPTCIERYVSSVQFLFHSGEIKPFLGRIIKLSVCLGMRELFHISSRGV